MPIISFKTLQSIFQASTASLFNSLSREFSFPLTIAPFMTNRPRRGEWIPQFGIKGPPAQGQWSDLKNIFKVISGIKFLLPTYSKEQFNHREHGGHPIREHPGGKKWNNSQRKYRAQLRPQGHLAIALKLPVKKAEFPQASITLEEGENYYTTLRPLKLKKRLSLTLLVLVTRLH